MAPLALPFIFMYLNVLNIFVYKYAQSFYMDPTCVFIYMYTASRKEDDGCHGDVIATLQGGHRLLPSSSSSNSFNSSDSSSDSSSSVRISLVMATINV